MSWLLYRIRESFKTCFYPILILIAEMFLLLLVGIIESIAKLFNKDIRIDIEGVD